MLLVFVTGGVAVRPIAATARASAAYRRAICDSAPDRPVATTHFVYAHLR